MCSDKVYCDRVYTVGVNSLCVYIDKVSGYKVHNDRVYGGVCSLCVYIDKVSGYRVHNDRVYGGVCSLCVYSDKVSSGYGVHNDGVYGHSVYNASVTS